MKENFYVITEKDFWILKGIVNLGIVEGTVAELVNDILNRAVMIDEDHCEDGMFLPPEGAQ